MDAFKHLNIIVGVQVKQLKLLVRYYDAVQEALGRERLGHHDGWDKVQVIADKIEDEIDLDTIRLGG